MVIFRGLDAQFTHPNAARYPTEAATVACASANEVCAGTAPAPIVEVDQAFPSGAQMAPACGIFGVGAPSVPATANACGRRAIVPAMLDRKSVV